MKFLNIDIDIKNKPLLDEGFIPLGTFFESFLSLADEPLSIAVFRNGGLVSVYDTFIIGKPEYIEADKYYASKLVKLILWLKGGVEVVIYGNDEIASHIKSEYCNGGAREFDFRFMSRVYEREFTVRKGDIADKIKENESPITIGGNLDGCRIGFDAGGSDRKVSAVVSGEVVYSEEVVWHPKENTDPAYHYEGIVAAFKTAASKMPRVDAIGISSAGIYVDNRAMVASLFIKIPDEVFNKEVKDIYIRAVQEIGDVPFMVANDGDVTALAGAMDLNSGNVLGIAMGTSEAVGYVDKNRNITGWLNELAFVPVDCGQSAMEDEWSGDIGCGVKYFSQDGVVKLAQKAGIQFAEGLSQAEKLKAVQRLMANGDETAASIYKSIGVYLGHTINLYAMFYNIEHILLLGRVMSGDGGGLIVSEARRVLAEEYPKLAKTITLNLPNEDSRRVGQSVAAAGLPFRG